MSAMIDDQYSSDVRLNQLKQPIGAALTDWTPVLAPPRTSMEGKFCRLEPLQVDTHAQDLFDAFVQDTEGRNWTYLPHGPFCEFIEFEKWMQGVCAHDQALFHAIVDLKTGRAVGIASYLRIKPAIGSIEVGYLNFSPLLQQKPAATEAMYLMMRRAFSELGYRRYEWKCDVLNAASRRAAERLGFQLEGIFRQATVYKDRDRDTAWFSILDRDWSILEPAYEEWLTDVRVSPDGKQKQSLGTIIKRHVAEADCQR
jgi:RimJ/RimL family protein N-acetyltransferase